VAASGTEASPATPLPVSGGPKSRPLAKRPHLPRMRSFVAFLAAAVTANLLKSAGCIPGNPVPCSNGRGGQQNDEHALTPSQAAAAAAQNAAAAAQAAARAAVVAAEAAKAANQAGLTPTERQAAANDAVQAAQNAANAAGWASGAAGSAQAATHQIPIIEKMGLPDYPAEPCACVGLLRG